MLRTKRAFGPSFFDLLVKKGSEPFFNRSTASGMAW